MRHWYVLAIAALCAHADVTLRYQISATEAALLPPGMDLSPAIQMKGAKGVTSLGRLKAIIDFTTRDVTIVDNDRKAFATFPAADYGARVAAANGAVAAAGKPPELPKMDFNTRKTGRTARFLDIETEETEAFMTMDLGQVGISVVVQAWTPRAAEVLRVPALREATAASLWLEHFLKMTDEFDLPGVQGVPLRMEFEVRTSGAPLAGVDPSKPIFHMTMEATELSTAALDDALFRVPEGFAAKPAEELLARQFTTPAAAADHTVRAFVPGLDPVVAKHPDYPEEARGAAGAVRLLVTVAADGSVLQAEPITGPAALRKFAVAAVEKYRYHPVLREGKPVTAITDTTVFFEPPGAHALPPPDMAEQMAASERVLALQRQFPRTSQQVLADLEHDVGEDRRTFHAVDLAKAALEAGDLVKAEAYAKDALAEKPDDNDAWNRGNRIHYGHIVLGRAALRRGDTAQARDHLLAAGKTPGSPQLNSFGPDFTLARELLEKGETAAVLDYLEECRAFWKMGGSRLDAWSRDIRAGRKPAF